VAPTSDPAAWERNLELLRRVGSRLHVGLHRRKDGSTFSAEEELQRTANLLRAVADGAPDAVFVKDRNGKYLLFNEAAARFVGKPVAEVLGNDDTALFDTLGAQRVMAADRRVMAAGQVETIEEVVTAAGTT